MNQKWMRRKRMLCIVLAVILVLAGLPLEGRRQENTTAEAISVPLLASEGSDAQDVAPPEENGEDPQEPSPPAAETGDLVVNSDQTGLTYEEAVAAVRMAMVNRETVIRVSVQSATDLGSNACLELYNRAVAHTGVPNEGDYLLRNMGGCSFSTTKTVSGGVYFYEFVLTPDWLSTVAQEAEVDEAVDALLGELELWEATEYEKIKGVYDWVTENVRYDYDNLDDDTYRLKYSTYSAIILKETVCQGYASLLYRLMLHLGVDCRIISGVSDDENHAWNIVKLEGRYYNVDSTWDRGLMGYYRHFLCTQENFGDHTRDPEYDTPEFHALYPMAIVPYVFNVAASGTVKAGMEWVLDGDTGTLTVAGTGSIPDYRYHDAPWYPYRESVQSIVLSEGITTVGERAFNWCINCTSVTLPNSLTAIREYGFDNLRALQYITLPPNLQTLGTCAFSECVALKTITLPDSVRTVGTSVFSNCPGLVSATLSAGMTRVPSSMFLNDTKLETVILPDSITYLETTAFAGSGIWSFHFPKNLTQMGSSVFSGCTRLYSYTVEEGNPSYKSVNGVLFSADGKTLLCYPAAKYGAYTVPEGTEYIASSAFRSSRYLTGITFGSTLKEIGNYAFSYCTGLRSVTFPANITKICDSAFRSCTYLTSVTFQNDSVILEEGGVFAECDYLRTITLPAKLTEIPGYLFYGCALLQSITIPSTVTRIGPSAFLDCDSLTVVTIPGNVKTVGRQAFDYCNRLKAIILEEGVQSLEDYCIRNAPVLNQVEIPDSLTSIGRENFEECPNITLYVNCGSYGFRYAEARDIYHLTSHPYEVITVTEPTCMEEGYTTYACRCGYAAYVDDYVDALGHDWSGWASVTEATCTEPGMEERYCLRCGDGESRVVSAKGHNYVGGICTVCGDYYVSFQSATISLAGNIALNFYVELGDSILADENAYMSFTMADGTVRTVNLADAEINVKDGVTRYVFTCELHAKQMADMVVAQMHLGDGTSAGGSKQYSVVTYAGYIIANEDVYAPYYPTLIPLLKAMLNYGTYSQTHFGYNMEHPANAGLGLALQEVTVDQVMDFKPKTAGSLTGLKAASVTLILRSETVLRFYFNLSEGHNINDYRFSISGNSVWPKYNPDNGRYYVEVTNIAAKNLDQAYGVTVTNAAGTESLSVVASAMSYVYQVLANPAYFQQDLKDLVKAMYAYMQAANAYFSA